MRVLIALLFLAVAFTRVAARDHFIFNITLTCTYHQREKWNYNMQFFDEDTISSDEPITMQKIGEARPGLAHFVMEGWLDGDEIWSAVYNVRMQLYHDCTEYEDEVALFLWLRPMCDIGKGTCRYRIVKDLKDASGKYVTHADLSYN